MRFCVLLKLGYDIGTNFMNAEDNVYAKSDWTFYLSDEEYKEF